MTTAKERGIIRVEGMLLNWGGVCDWKAVGNAGAPSGGAASGEGLQRWSASVALNDWCEIERLLGASMAIEALRSMMEWVWVRRSRGEIATAWHAVVARYGNRELPEHQLKAVGKHWDKTMELWKGQAAVELGYVPGERRWRFWQAGDLARRHDDGKRPERCGFCGESGPSCGVIDGSLCAGCGRTVNLSEVKR